MRKKKYDKLILGMLLLCLCIFSVMLSDTTTVQAAKKQTKKTTAKKKKRVKIQKVTITNKDKLRRMQVGQSRKIKVRLKPSKKSLYKKLKFKSSKPKVATVSKKGKVKALKNGTTVISVKATGGSKKKARVKLRVYTLVKKVRFTTQEGAFLVKGDTKTLETSVSPSTASNKKLEWISSNPSVATVSKNGKVKGVGNGTVEITARALDESGKSDTYVLQVFSLSKKNKIYAHRGYSAKAPENSLAAVREAAKAGFYGVELDFWKTKDGIYVANHSNSLQNMYGLDMKITESNYSQISNYCMTAGNGIEEYPSEGIATLDEVMKVVASTSLHFNLEIKWGASKQELREILDILKPYHINERIQVISFREKVLIRLQDVMEERQEGTSEDEKDTLPDDLAGASSGAGITANPIQKVETPVKLALLTNTPEERLEDCVNAYTWCVKKHINIIVNYNYMTQRIKDIMDRAGLSCGVYTVNDAYTAFIYLKGMEVDSLTSNERLFTS